MESPSILLGTSTRTFEIYAFHILSGFDTSKQFKKYWYQIYKDYFLIQRFSKIIWYIAAASDENIVIS